jgi:hypothetical protein
LTNAATEGRHEFAIKGDGRLDIALVGGPGLDGLVEGKGGARRNDFAVNSLGGKAGVVTLAAGAPLSMVA